MDKNDKDYYDIKRLKRENLYTCEVFDSTGKDTNKTVCSTVAFNTRTGEVEQIVRDRNGKAIIKGNERVTEVNVFPAPLEIRVTA